MHCISGRFWNSVHPCDLFNVFVKLSYIYNVLLSSELQLYIIACIYQTPLVPSTKIMTVHVYFLEALFCVFWTSHLYPNYPAGFV